MKQTTNNKSPNPDSCQRGWRLFSIVAAYFTCSEGLRPYLIKYLETAAYDKRRAYHGTATVCLQNLRKTVKYGGRKNVPSVEEIMAISAGRNAKRQIYRLPGGTERVINTKCTTVVQVSQCHFFIIINKNLKQYFASTIICLILRMSLRKCAASYPWEIHTKWMNSRYIVSSTVMLSRCLWREMNMSLMLPPSCKRIIKYFIWYSAGN